MHRLLPKLPISTYNGYNGNCAKTVWTFVGLSIPEQTLLLFCAVLIVSVWQTCRAYPTR